MSVWAMPLPLLLRLIYRNISEKTLKFGSKRLMN
jgi:hypothetical protein